MTSKTFVIYEAEMKPRRCSGLPIVLILLAIILIALLVGFFGFNSDQRSGCMKPELDPYGKSNWTMGAKTVLFECAPGHPIDGHEEVEVVTSECIDSFWVPQPPVCVTLPIRLDCVVNKNGLQGVITMWQESKSSPTSIFGFLKTNNVDKTKMSLSEVITLSQNTCKASYKTDISMPKRTLLEELDDEVEIRFNTSQLLGYKKAELHVTLVFIDTPKKLSTAVVSVHQDEETVVMPTKHFKERSGTDIAVHEHGGKDRSKRAATTQTLQSNSTEEGAPTDVLPTSNGNDEMHENETVPLEPKATEDMTSQPEEAKSNNELEKVESKKESSENKSQEKGEVSKVPGTEDSKEPNKTDVSNTQAKPMNGTDAKEPGMTENNNDGSVPKVTSPNASEKPGNSSNQIPPKSNGVSNENNPANTEKPQAGKDGYLVEPIGIVNLMLNYISRMFGK